MTSVLVTGGNGVLGRRLVPLLLADGHRVIVASRKPKARADGAEEVALDLRDPDSMVAAVNGRDVIVHAATDPYRSRRVDVEGTRALIAAARHLDSTHLIYISIVGIDDHPYPYYRAKAAAEQAIEESDLLYSILRTTQFHDLIPVLGDMLTKSPVALLPGDVPLQTLDTGTAAARLAELVETGASGRVPDIGGPEVATLESRLRDYYAVKGLRRPRVRFRIPGRTGAAFRSGALLTDNKAVGSPTWDMWLKEYRRSRSA